MATVSSSHAPETKDLVSVAPLDGFHRASQRVDELIRAISPDQWQSPTPCSEWDVRALVNHLVSEDASAPLVLAGRTAAEIGDRFEGDVVGDDPVGAWERARQGVIDAASATSMDQTVHLFFGDLPAASYLTQLAQGHLIHSWDLARAIGAEERLDEELVSWTYEAMKPQEEMLGQSGVFAAAIEPASGAEEQTKLLNLTGRRP